MAEKHTKDAKCHLVLREMQIETVVSYSYKPTRTAKKKKPAHAKCWQEGEAAGTLQRLAGPWSWITA